MKRFFHLFMLPAITFAAAGCMAEGPFPSLAQRDVERQPLGEPVRAMPNVADDPALRATIGDLVAQARRGDQAFELALPLAQSAASAAGPPPSDSWVAAQEHISRSEAARADTTRALGDLDQLALARSNLPTSREDQAMLDAAIVEVQRLVTDQQSRLDRLKALIAG